ncbi:MAG: hypothetical protein H6739_36885 [Alphaproteobacteria bacterium]|nr:hypothetical protein [Alphaproteobacteria bacterium]
MPSSRALPVALLALCVPRAALAWPADADWDPVQDFGADLVDPCGDVNGNSWWDIVGDASDPAGYYHYDGTDIWFRLRIGGEPLNFRSNGDPRSWKNFGWGVMIESDWDSTNVKYDFIIYVDGNNDQITLSENTSGNTAFTTDAPEIDLSTYTAPVAPSNSASADHAGYVDAGTDLCGLNTTPADYFVDWYVPWADLAAATGASDPSELYFVFGTSASSKALLQGRRGLRQQRAELPGLGRPRPQR